METYEEIALAATVAMIVVVTVSDMFTSYFQEKLKTRYLRILRLLKCMKIQIITLTPLE